MDIQHVNTGELLTIDGAISYAQSLGAKVTYWALYRWVGRNNVPTYKVGRTVLLNKNDVRRYVDRVREQ